jgi:hypothetical protein
VLKGPKIPFSIKLNGFAIGDEDKIGLYKILACC